MQSTLHLLIIIKRVLKIHFQHEEIVCALFPNNNTQTLKQKSQLSIYLLVTNNRTLVLSGVRPFSPLFYKAKPRLLLSEGAICC